MAPLEIEEDMVLFMTARIAAKNTYSFLRLGHVYGLSGSVELKDIIFLESRLFFWVSSGETSGARESVCETSDPFRSSWSPATGLERGFHGHGCG